MHPFHYEDIVVHVVRYGNTHSPILLAAWLMLGGLPGVAWAELAPPDYAVYHAERSYSEGLLALRGGDTEAALASARAALALVPDDPDSLYLMGICQLFAEEWADAEAALVRVVSLRPEQAEAYHDLGLVQLKLGHGDEAATAFARLSDLRPDSWYGPYREAQTAALIRRDWEACEGHLTDAVQRGFPWIATLPVDPEWGDVAEEPAFLEMLGRVLQDLGGDERSATPRP